MSLRLSACAYPVQCRGWRAGDAPQPAPDPPARGASASRQCAATRARCGNGTFDRRHTIRSRCRRSADGDTAARIRRAPRARSPQRLAQGPAQVHAGGFAALTLLHRELRLRQIDVLTHAASFRLTLPTCRKVRTPPASRESTRYRQLKTVERRHRRTAGRSHSPTQGIWRMAQPGCSAICKA